MECVTHTNSNNEAPDSAAQSVAPGCPDQAPDSAAQSVAPGCPDQAPDSGAQTVAPGCPDQAPDSAAQTVAPGCPDQTTGIPQPPSSKSEQSQEANVKVEATSTSSDSTGDNSQDVKQEDGNGEAESKEADGGDIKLNPELYGYLNTAEFTSEIFKIEINNLPKRIGFGQLKKRLLNLNVQPVKIKLINGGEFAFVTFRNENERASAIQVLDGHVWKGRTWKVKKALPKADPLAVKRKQEEGADGIDDASGNADEPQNKMARLAEEEQDLPVEERLQNAVTPLWNLPYSEQLQRKENNIHGFLRKFCSIILRNNPVMESNLRQVKSEQSGMCCVCDPIKASPVVDGYRNKCEFTIGQSIDGVDKTVGFRLGAYKGGQLNVVEPTICMHIPELMKSIIKDVQVYLQQVSTLKGFDPKTRDGHWQVLTVRITRSHQTLLIFSMHPQDLEEDVVAEEKRKMVEYFQTGPGSATPITSLYFQTQTEKFISRDPNASQIELLMGEPHIQEDLLGMKFRISHNAFFQVNTAAAEVLYRTIGDWCKITPDSLVLDVCCGTGTIGLALAKQCKKVIGIEMVQEAVDDAKFNAQLNNIENTEFHCGKAEDILPKIVRTLHLGFSEVVAVVDPPRGGLHPQVVKALRKATFIKRLIYVSCNVAGATHNLTDFTRAVSRRIKGPEFTVTRAIPIDLFPHSNHIELVLLLEREKEF